MSYFTAVLARDGRKWFAHDLDVDALADLEELADELRNLERGEEEPVLLLIECEDAWWAVVRVDGEEDPRVFVSDAAGAAASTYAELLEVSVDADAETDPVDGCAGDLDILADLGTSTDRLTTMCDDEVMPMDALAMVAERAGFAEALDSLR